MLELVCSVSPVLIVLCRTVTQNYRLTFIIKSKKKDKEQSINKQKTYPFSSMANSELRDVFPWQQLVTPADWWLHMTKEQTQHAIFVAHDTFKAL